MALLDFIFHPKKKSLRQAYEEAASAIEAFVAGRGRKWDWDNYISFPRGDQYLESVRLQCDRAPDDYPPERDGHYCSDEGMSILSSLAAEIRAKIPSHPDEKRT
jgi:hypothetical protein